MATALGVAAAVIAWWWPSACENPRGSPLDLAQTATAAAAAAAILAQSACDANSSSSSHKAAQDLPAALQLVSDIKFVFLSCMAAWLPRLLGSFTKQPAPAATQLATAAAAPAATPEFWEEAADGEEPPCIGGSSRSGRRSRSPPAAASEAGSVAPSSDPAADPNGQPAVISPFASIPQDSTQPARPAVPGICDSATSLGARPTDKPLVMPRTPVHHRQQQQHQQGSSDNLITAAAAGPAQPLSPDTGGLVELHSIPLYLPAGLAPSTAAAAGCSTAPVQRRAGRSALYSSRVQHQLLSMKLPTDVAAAVASGTECGPGEPDQQKTAVQQFVNTHAKAAMQQYTRVEDDRQQLLVVHCAAFYGCVHVVLWMAGTQPPLPGALPPPPAATSGSGEALWACAVERHLQQQLASCAPGLQGRVFTHHPAEGLQGAAQQVMLREVALPLPQPGDGSRDPPQVRVVLPPGFASQCQAAGMRRLRVVVTSEQPSRVLADLRWQLDLLVATAAAADSAGKEQLQQQLHVPLPLESLAALGAAARMAEEDCSHVAVMLLAEGDTAPAPESSASSVECKQSRVQAAAAGATGGSLLLRMFPVLLAPPPMAKELQQLLHTIATGMTGSTEAAAELEDVSLADDAAAEGLGEGPREEGSGSFSSSSSWRQLSAAYNDGIVPLVRDIVLLYQQQEPRAAQEVEHVAGAVLAYLTSEGLVACQRLWRLQRSQPQLPAGSGYGAGEAAGIPALPDSSKPRVSPFAAVAATAAAAAVAEASKLADASWGSADEAEGEMHEYVKPGAGEEAGCSSSGSSSKPGEAHHGSGDGGASSGVLSELPLRGAGGLSQSDMQHVLRWRDVVGFPTSSLEAAYRAWLDQTVYQVDMWAAAVFAMTVGGKLAEAGLLGLRGAPLHMEPAAAALLASYIAYIGGGFWIMALLQHLRRRGVLTSPAARRWLNRDTVHTFMRVALSAYTCYMRLRVVPDQLWALLNANPCRSFPLVMVMSHVLGALLTACGLWSGVVMVATMSFEHPAMLLGPGCPSLAGILSWQALFGVVHCLIGGVRDMHNRRAFLKQLPSAHDQDKAAALPAAGAASSSKGVGAAGGSAKHKAE